jgi:hypothetical protein
MLCFCRRKAQHRRQLPLFITTPHSCSITGVAKRRKKNYCRSARAAKQIGEKKEKEIKDKRKDEYGLAAAGKKPEKEDLARAF